MILLTKGQPLFDNPNMVVYDATGYYEDGGSVVCASTIAPEEPLARYEAKFIAYGGIVYTITDPEQLMAEVLKIDPVSLFGKTNEQSAIDKLVEKIETIESPELPTENEISEPLIESDPKPLETPTTPESDLNIEPPIESEITPTPESLETPTTPESAPIIEPIIESPTPVDTSTTTETNTTTP